MRAGRRPRGRARCFPSSAADGPSRPPRSWGCHGVAFKAACAPLQGRGVRASAHPFPVGRLAAPVPPWDPTSRLTGRLRAPRRDPQAPSPLKAFGEGPVQQASRDSRSDGLCAVRRCSWGGPGGPAGRREGGSRSSAPGCSLPDCPIPSGLFPPHQPPGLGKAGARPPRSDLDS